VLSPALVARARIFAEQRDALECRKTTEIWETLDSHDAEDLYNGSCFRAITASLSPGGSQSTDAGLAIRWLSKAVAAAFNRPGDVAQIMKDSDIDVLRERADFRFIVAKLLDRNFPGNPLAR
jgi:hypothetical protein